jgi:hypothetical protein
MMTDGALTRALARPTLLLTVAALGASVSWAPPAPAQVRWDVGLLAGATWRVTTGDRAPHPTPGPSAEIRAHLAVVPMLRVGPYASFDLSPASGATARQVYAVGLRAKVTPPVLAAPWRGWVFAGVGFADGYTPSGGGNGADSLGMLELPVGIGIGYRVRGPWELCVELGARVVLAKGPIHAGAPSASAGPSSPLVRDDLLAVALSIGVSFGP